MQHAEIIRLLEDRGCSQEVIKHILAVRDLALRIARSLRCPVDLELVEMGALLHDIGRAKTHSIKHAVIGAEMARKMGVDERVVRIIERHIGAGITRQEAVELGLPEKDYVPETVEEKIVAYADNLIDGHRVVSFEEALERFKRLLGEKHPAIQRFINMHKELQELR